MKSIALAAIRAYQRWISPHKGFQCAHRLHGGGSSCSTVGFRLIRRHGLWDGWPLLRERLRRCGDVARQVHARPASAQRGDCDLPCDLPCEGPDCGGRGGGRWCDLLSCGCDACDLFDRKDKKEDGKRRPARKDPRTRQAP